MTHKHKCKDCGKEFEVDDQDSKAHYCAECRGKRVLEGGKQSPKKEEK